MTLAEQAEQTAAFEAWATSQGYEVKSRKADGRYWSSHTHGVWEAWQARAALAQQQVPQLEKVLRQGEPVAQLHTYVLETGAGSCQQATMHSHWRPAPPPGFVWQSTCPLYTGPAPDQAARIAELEQQVADLRKDAERWNHLLSTIAANDAERAEALRLIDEGITKAGEKL